MKLLSFNIRHRWCFAELSADLAEAAIAHCQLIVVSKFIDKLKEPIPGKGIKQILEVLCQVYTLSTLHKHQSEFLATTIITPKQVALAFTQLRHLYSQMEAVAALRVQYEADFRPNMTIVAKALQPLLNFKPAGPESQT